MYSIIKKQITSRIYKVMSPVTVGRLAMYGITFLAPAPLSWFGAAALVVSKLPVKYIFSYWF